MIECTDLAALKAANTTNGSAHLAEPALNGIFFWVPGNYVGQADDENIVEANGTALTDGAWIRQSAASIAFRQVGAGAIIRSAQDKLRERPSIRDNGATGMGAGTNDYAPLQSALADYGGGTIEAVRGDYRADTPLAPPAGTRLIGQGSEATIFRRVSGPSHVVEVTADDVAIKSAKMIGVTAGGDAKTNTAIRVAGAQNTVVEDVEATGMSGSAFYATGGSAFGRYFNNRVHGLTGSLANASDVFLYTTTSDNIAGWNRLEGGRSVGVHMQITSIRNKAVFNQIAGHSAYGILDYDTIPRGTYNLIAGNTVRAIVGDEQIEDEANPGFFTQSGGAGIYTASTGGQIIALNDVSECNRETANETLVPGGIALNGFLAPVPALVHSNVSRQNYWYGIMSAFWTMPVSITGNLLWENVKDQIYVKNSNHPLIALNIGRSVITPSERIIAVNVAASGYHGYAGLFGNRCQGASLRAIDMLRTRFSSLVGNIVSDLASSTAYACVLDSCDGSTLVGNVYDGSAAADAGAVTLRIHNCTDTMLLGNVTIPSNTSDIAVLLDSTCTRTFFDKSNSIYAKAEPMNFISNESAGCIVEQFGSGPPTLLQHQVGDKVWARSPVAGGNVGWVCIAAGTPGSWKTFGEVAA